MNLKFLKVIKMSYIKIKHLVMIASTRSEVDLVWPGRIHLQQYFFQK